MYYLVNVRKSSMYLLKKYIESIREFGTIFTTLKIFYLILKKLNIANENSYNKIILWYIKKHYSKYIDNNYTSNINTQDYKVFVCWWQGLNEHTPEIVKCCINKIKTVFNNHEVIVIDKNNLSQYTRIPSYIIEKKDKGLISLTHFSDVIRFHLLSEYGGCWIDSTCWVEKGIEEEISSFDFYTNKIRQENGMLGYISLGRWSGFFLKTSKENIIVNNVKTMLDKYWNEHNKIIDYLLFDYFIEIMYLLSPKAKKIIDGVPYNNEFIHELILHLKEEYDPNYYSNLICKTKIFKLTYKKDYSDRCANSYYDVIVRKAVCQEK